MSSTVLFFLVACLATFCAAEDVQPSQRDLVNCQPIDGDVELYSGVVEKPYEVLQKVTSDLTVEAGSAVIHCIKCINTNSDGHPAIVTITKGGVDYSTVSLHFESEWMRGIYYNVTLTGQ